MKIAHKYRGLVWLALLFVLLPFATWRYALRDTVRAVFDCRRLSREVRTHAQSAERVSDTEPLAGRELVLSGELLSMLLPEAARHEVALTDFRPVVTLNEQGMEIHTATLTLRGPYARILHVVRHLETTIPACRLASLEFRLRSQPNRRMQWLEAVLCVEQIVRTDKTDMP